MASTPSQDDNQFKNGCLGAIFCVVGPFLVYEIASDIRDAFKAGATDYSLRSVAHHHSKSDQPSGFYLDIGVLVMLCVLGVYIFVKGSNKVLQLVSNFWKS